MGGRVVMGKEELNTKTPVAPIDMTKDLCCPLLGLFGNEDRALLLLAPTALSAEQAMDGWSKVFAFFASIWRSRRFGHVHVHHRDRTRGGHGKARDEWFPLSQVVVAYDHARHAPLGDVITLDLSTRTSTPVRGRGSS